MTESVPEDELRLCDFCSSIDWTQITTGPFNPGKAPLQAGQIKSGEHNLGSIRSATTCELCNLIGDASQALKPWWPIGHLLEQPEQITCAFWSKRNRLGSSVQARNLSQVDTLLDMLYAGLKPGFSSTELVKQKFFDELCERGIHLDEKGNGATGSGNEPRRNNSLNRLLVLAGISPVDWKSQTFMQLHPCLYLIPSVDDYAAGNERFSTFPTGRIIRPEANVRLLRRWYETCLAQHEPKCSQPPWLAPDTPWPARLRLIDVRQLCLVEAPEQCPYFALSYVWGDESDPFQMTGGILGDMKKPGFFENQALPKTIVDAIELTKGMGVDFLWVDRLCIMQDSNADKAVQIPQMDLVYSHAAMTIVAASGTAVDGLAGINGTPRIIDQRVARVAKDLSLMNVLRLDQAYEDSRWTTRGWTFQEGLCSRRALIITSDQIFWSCESAKCCESIAFEAFPTTVAPNDIIWHVLSGHKVFGEFGGGNNFAYSELDGMIRGYCNRKLGVQPDALDAFTGVLRRVAFNTGHEFHWGHSVSARFDESLAWCNIVWYYDHEWEVQAKPARRRERHRVRSDDGTVREVPFPSWSWVGWQNVLGVTRAAPRQVVLEPELDIMKLSVNGKALPLCIPSKESKLQSASEINMCGIDRSTSAGWKGSTVIDASLFHQDDEDGEFEDSGRLLFWTSHAALDIEDGKIFNDEKEQVGELKPFRPYQAEKPTGKHSFIVVSRKHNDNNNKVLKAERRLNVLLVEWEDIAMHIASRICSAEVDEEAWVKLGEKREWILVTLT
ncbi:HET-domain-containing protein [Hypomontagnella monticulosa]|nr:HET-domain-containing protein [Hypomontagnella monticulosa]